MIIFAKRHLLNLLKNKGFEIDDESWPFVGKRDGESVIIGDRVGYVGDGTYETKSYRDAIRHFSSCL